VSNLNGQLDGNSNGIGGDNYELIGTPGNGLFRCRRQHRRRTVDNVDFADFRTVFGVGPSIFDFNNDGNTDTMTSASFASGLGR
jgi:hypothetical protein